MSLISGEIDSRLLAVCVVGPLFSEVGYFMKKLREGERGKSREETRLVFV